MTTATLPNGSTISSSVRLPFAVRRNGEVRSFGTLAAARAAAGGGAVIFFDYEPGYGRFLERS